MADLVPVRSDVKREAIVDCDLLPWTDPPGSSEGADEAKPGMVNPGPDTAGTEAVVCLVSQRGAVVRRVLGLTGDVDVAGRGEVDSDKNKSNVKCLMSNV